MNTALSRWLAGACLSLATLAASAPALAQQAPVRSAELRIAYPVDIPSWDPTSVTFPAGQSIYKTVFDSPLHMGDGSKVEAALIKEWRWIDQSAQKLQVVLQDNAVFHDGSPVTAEDLRFTFDRARANKQIALGAMMPTVASIDVQGPKTAVIGFAKPTPAAPKFLAFLSAYILPKAYFERVGPQGFQEKPVGAGPYRVVEYQRGSRIVLEAFDRYWRGQAPIKNVTIEIVTDPSARVAALESGRVDVALQVPVREINRLAKLPALSASVYPYDEIYILQMPSYTPEFRDLQVRRAMQLAIDKKGLSRAFYAGVAEPISVLASKGSPGDVPDFDVPFGREQAAAELAKAGYGPDKPLAIKLFSTNGSFPSDYEMARAIAQMWTRIGITTTVEEITLAKYLELSHSSKLTGVMLYSWANATADPENFAGRILDPRLRFSTWKAPELADRIDTLLVEPDEAKRMNGYRALNRAASENAWSLPVLQAVSTIAFKKDLNVVTHKSGYVLACEFSWKK